MLSNIALLSRAIAVGVVLTPATLSSPQVCTQQIDRLDVQTSWNGLAIDGDTLIAVGGAGFARAPVVFERTAPGSPFEFAEEIPLEQFGFPSGQIRLDGDTLVINEPSSVNSNLMGTGRVLVYKRFAETWVLDATLEDPQTANGPSGERFGYSSALDGDRLVVANSSPSRPSVEFERVGGTWQYKLHLPPTDDAPRVWIDLEGDNLVLGGGNGSIFRRSYMPDEWVLEERLELPPAFPFEFFSTSIDGGSAVLGVGTLVEIRRRDVATATWPVTHTIDFASFDADSRVWDVELHGDDLFVTTSFPDAQSREAWIHHYHVGSSSAPSLVRRWQEPDRDRSFGLQVTDHEVAYISQLFGGSGNALMIQNRSCGIVGSPTCVFPRANSTGHPARLDVLGSSSLTAANASLTASGLPMGSFGMFLTGRSLGIAFFPGGSGGVLCLSQGARYSQPGNIQLADSTGSIRLPIDWASMPTLNGSTAATVGETWIFQAWHRDLASFGSSNFSNASEVQIVQ